MQLTDAHQVHVDDQPEIGKVHLGECLVAQDAGIVDQDVDLAPARDGLVDHRLDGIEVGDRRGDGDRRAAGRLDLVRDSVGRSLAEVIDDDTRAAASRAARHAPGQARLRRP